MTYAYIPVTVTNSESTATPTDFQQLVTVDLSYYSAFLNQDLSNTFFSSDTAGSTVVTSWLESGNTYPFNSVNFWLYLPDGIGASSSITVYLQVDLSNTSHFNDTTTGVAPNLTSTYAEYDDGANVFTNYWNFAGTSLPTGWTSGGVNGASTSVTVNNGVTLSSSYIMSPQLTSSDTYVLDSLTTLKSSNQNFYNSLLFDTTLGSGNVPDDEVVFNVLPSGSGTNIAQVISGTGTTLASDTFSISENVPYMLTTMVSGTDVTGEYNYGTTSSILSNSSATSENYAYVYLGVWNTEYFVQYARVRAYPPNGVMPSATAGTSSGFPYYNTTTYEDLL